MDTFQCICDSMLLICRFWGSSVTRVLYCNNELDIVNMSNVFYAGDKENFPVFVGL